MFEKDTKWIGVSDDIGDACPEFVKNFTIGKQIKNAHISITAQGVYEAECNGKRVGDFVLAPGWTSYEKRLQVQTYDIKPLLKDGDNKICITVGRGWYASHMPGWNPPGNTSKEKRISSRRAVIAEISVEYEDGSFEKIVTDRNWKWHQSGFRFSEIYDGEVYDASFLDEKFLPVEPFDPDLNILIPQEGEYIKELECINARKVFKTPLGETVVDFGQVITGYVEFDVRAKAQDKVEFLHGEVLDRDGNFYNANYRGAKAQVTYICKDGDQTWHPHLTFFGFRYIKLVSFPGNPAKEDFRAYLVSSEMKRTGFIRTGHEKINQLISNILWGQRDNFLDVPTDCPQRDERLGWTGDAQVFAKSATLNYDTEKFYRKWLHDLKADQRPDGAVGKVIPDLLAGEKPSAAWGDAAVIIPWQVWQTYGNREVLNDQFSSMKAWVDYIGSVTEEPYLWIGGEHYGDWLGLDAPVGSYRGSSREEFIASAFYAYDVKLLIMAGEEIGQDMSEYRALLDKIKCAFKKRFPECTTQTESVLVIHFDLTDDPKAEADRLAERIRNDGMQMKTGFVGTPYLLHVLTKYGYPDIAYELLLREKYPSWLYSVNKGATTVWEHWDGIMEDGSFWSPNMNSFNHYAFGSVIDWIYERAAGITHTESAAGFSEAIIAPCPDPRLKFMDTELMTRSGMIRSMWKYTDDGIRYEIEVEMPALIKIGGITKNVGPGRYIFWG
ncbi:MAG: glycoside hydrolase family 78 protein [Lachnospiraceae bacterium]|nr:glycoside hydrolase family 78 protein [Lachnospiraceae bacterium]